MGRWVRALGTGSLLSPRSHALQIRPQNVGLGPLTADLYYAMGFDVTGGWIAASPQLTGYNGVVSYLPAKRTTVVVFTTQGPKGRPSVAYASAIYNRLGALLAPSRRACPFARAPLLTTMNFVALGPGSDERDGSGDAVVARLADALAHIRRLPNAGGPARGSQRCAVSAADGCSAREHDTRHITIDVRVDGDEISGRVGEGTDRPTPFLGWLGPIGALDRLLGIASSTAEEPHAPD